MLYIRREGGVRKSQVIHAIKLGCNLLLQDSDLVIIALTGTTADNIGDSTIYTSFAIGIRNRHRKSNILSNLWITQYIMIVDKLSIFEIEILLNIGKQLAKARSFSNLSTAVFNDLPIIIVMGDFYQFLPITGQRLWNELQINEDYNGKTLWLSFSSVITLI